MEYP
ncbi:hypothetical protein D041_0465A, partial [Vibrio parahaemolyticus EKP-008]|jgi:hypothetical protein